MVSSTPVNLIFKQKCDIIVELRIVDYLERGDDMKKRIYAKNKARFEQTINKRMTEKYYSSQSHKRSKLKYNHVIKGERK